MGTLILPASGLVYLDANSVIYTVEKHPVYGPLLHPLWQAAQAKLIEVVRAMTSRQGIGWHAMCYLVRERSPHNAAPARGCADSAHWCASYAP